jgi:hypothetical protein
MKERRECRDILFRVFFPSAALAALLLELL